MNKNVKEQTKDIADLADDALALMEATADMTGQKVQRARKRVALALERGKATGENLIEASAGMASDNIQKLRERITAAMEHGREIYDDVHDDLARRTKVADHAVRENPYKVMGISMGVGALVGYFISSRHSHHAQ